MDDHVNERRRFLKSAVAGGAVAAVGVPGAVDAQANAAAAAAAAKADAAPKGYTYLNPEEAAFVEALVDHMVPADNLTPKGTDLGLAI